MKLRYFMQWVFKQGVRHSTSEYFHWYIVYFVQEYYTLYSQKSD